MGRLEYLKRMAFGRSPYSDHEEDAATLLNHAQDGSQQQYNSKGHPINPAKEQLSASLRQAQNEVLAIVGLLERKGSASIALRSQQISDREHERVQERLFNQRELESAATLSRHAAIASMILTWYPRTLLMRSLAGAYDTNDPLASIISRDMYASGKAPLLYMLGILWPGLQLRVAYNELSALTTWQIDQILGSSANLANFAIRATAQWCLLPLLQLAIGAQLNPAGYALSNSGNLPKLGNQIQQAFSANLSLLGLSQVALLSLTGAFYAGSLSFLVQQRAAPPANSVAQYSQGPSVEFRYNRARSATSLFPQMVEQLGKVRASLLAWLNLDISTQISTLSSRNHMGAEAGHPAVDPQFSQNDRSVTDLHASAQPSFHTRVAPERFLSMTDAILMQSVQLPVEYLILCLSARLLGPSTMTSHHHFNANGGDMQLFGNLRNGVDLDTISRVGLSLSLVYLAEMAAYGASRMMGDLLASRNRLG